MLEVTGRLTAPTHAVEIADGGFRVSTQTRVFSHSGSQQNSQAREENLNFMSEIPDVLMNMKECKTF